VTRPCSTASYVLRPRLSKETNHVFGRGDDEWDCLLDNAITALKDQAGRPADDVLQRAP
jgi:hypothetical protein